MFGRRALTPYKLLFIVMTWIGCTGNLKLVWSVSDTFNGLMAIPNLIAVVLLYKEVFQATRAYLARKRKGRLNGIRHHFTRRG